MKICQYAVTQFVGYLIQIIPLMFLFYAPYKQEFLRFSKKKILLYLGIFFVLTSAAASIFLGVLVMYETAAATIVWTANIFFNLDLMIWTVVYFLSFKARTSGKILFYMFVIEYGIALYIFAEIGVKFIDCPVLPGAPYGLDTIIIYSVSTVITFPLIYYFLRRREVQEVVQMNKRNLRMITGCSILIVVLTIVALQMEVGLKNLHEGLEASIYESVLLVCLLAANLVSYFIYFFCSILEREKEKMETKLTAYELQYENVYEGMERERRMHHNLRHHFRTLGVLASDGKMEELQSYINDYLENLNKMEMRKVSGNPVINSVLSYYIQQAEEQNIQVQCDIQVKENYAFSIKDMTVLLGNAMENALKASRSCPPDRAYIGMMIKQYKKSILIKIENKICPGEIAALSAGKPEKSYGLASVEMIARKYEGSVDIEQTKDMFVLRIVLNSMETKEGGAW